MTFARTEEGRRWARDSGKAGSDRECGILVLMFPGRFEGWLDHDLPDLPLVKGSETYVAPERHGGARMDIQGREGAFLAELVSAHFGVLKRGNRPNVQLTKMEIVPGADKGAPLRSLGAAIG